MSIEGNLILFQIRRENVSVILFLIPFDWCWVTISSFYWYKFIFFQTIEAFEILITLVKLQFKDPYRIFNPFEMHQIHKC